MEFESEDKQKAALAALDGTSLADRVISAKIANKDNEPREKKSGDNNNNNNADGEAKDGNRRRRTRRRGDGEAKEGEEKKPRAPRKEKKESATLVYVSNLSFDVDDNSLAKLFDGLNVKSAHVAVRANGRSKG